MHKIFNKNEIEVLGIFFNSKHDKNFYPAEIEKITRKKISRAGVKIICENLVKYGILQIDLEPSPNHSRSSSHYILQKNIKSFTTLVTMFFRTLAKSEPFNWQCNAHYSFMTSQFAQQMINSDLVRYVLSLKEIQVYRAISLEKPLEKSDKNYKRFPKCVWMSFPIRTSTAKITELHPKIHHNRDNVNDDKIKKIINNYYEKIEQKEIILPILYLIQISPSALEYFLNDWKPWNTEGSYSFNSLGLELIEHVLFRLIWNTVNDLSINRHIPTYGDVHEAYVSGGNSTTLSKSLLHLSCKGGKMVEYNAGFDTNWFFTEDESGDVYDVQTNPENCSVTIISDM